MTIGVDNQVAKGVIPSANGFCLLSELMTSPRNKELVVAKNVDAEVYWYQFQRDVEAIVQRLQKSSCLIWALCFDDSYYFAVAFFAAVHAGKKIILPGNYQPAALAELASRYEAVIHDRIEFSSLECEQIMLPDHLGSGQQERIEFLPLSSKNLTVTLFTSGSSGTPKAVVKKIEHIEAEIAQLEKTWGGQLKNARIVSTVSHQHIYGLLFRVLWPLCAGRAFDRRMMNYPEQVMDQAAPNVVLVTSPALLKRLGQELVTQSYCAIFSSGGPLSEAAAQQCKALFQQLPFEVFGSTETGGIGYRQQHNSQSPWRLFDVIEMELNSEECLRVCSPFIDPGSWYQTSDRCQLLGNDQFMLVGRTDRIVKVEEKRISLPEVEKRLCELNWIDEAAVIVLNDQNRLILAAVITLTREGYNQLEESGKGRFKLEIRNRLRQWLEPVGIPRRFRIVDDIPLNSQGKRLVKDLEQLFIVAEK